MARVEARHPLCLTACNWKRHDSETASGRTSGRKDEDRRQGRVAECAADFLQAASDGLTSRDAGLGRDDEFRQVIYTIVQVLSEVESCGAAFGRAIGLTRSQFAVLMGVAYQQGDSGVRINMLARYVQLASTHVTTEVGVLSRKGLVSKTVDPEDRRSVLVRLSPKGEATVTSIAPFVRRVNDLLFKDISREQLKALREIFTVLSLNSEFALAEVRRSEREQAANLQKLV